MQYNYIQKIADEYNIPFLNGCLYNHELDYTLDSMGDGGHLNYSGVTKWTKILGEYLVDNYELIDHRGDSKYRAWEYQSARLAARIRKDAIAQANSIEAVMSVLQVADNLCCIVETRGNYLKDDVDIPVVMIGENLLNFEQEKVYIIRDGEIVANESGSDDYNISIYLKNGVLNVKNESGSKAIILDGQPYGMVKNGVNILIFDELLNEIVGKIGINADNGYELVKWKS